MGVAFGSHPGNLYAMRGSSIRMMTAGMVFAFSALGVAGEAAGGGSPPPPPSVDIPFEKYTLKNGLTVILHQDRSLPLVAVNILLKVGSRYERQGRTGFAHLFEHLMFMGTRRVPTKMFDSWMEAEGGWNNAWTSNDRTDYYDVGPAHALPLLLWMEADRFSSLADDMDLEKLNAQRDVVRNERRQTSENEPYGKLELRLPELMWPKGHPYHHPVIGSHADLQAATVDDVKSFFREWYIPANASLVIAGDFDTAEVKKMVEDRFGWIPAGTVTPAPKVPATKLAGVVRETIEDNVELPKVLMAWHSPKHHAPGDADLDLLAAILDRGKSSRLYKALVYDEPLAQTVSAYQASQDQGSYFAVEAIARPGVTPAALEKAIDEQLKKVLAEGVTGEELERARNQYETGFVSRLQSLASRASMLNMYESTEGDPGFAERDLQRYRDASTASVHKWAKSTIDLEARVVVHVIPKADDTKGASGGSSQ